MSLEKIIVDAMRGEREEYWRDPSETRTAISDEDYARAIVAYLSRAGYVLVERALVEEAAKLLDDECEGRREFVSLASRLRATLEPKP